jgi:hypothetical protein
MTEQTKPEEARPIVEVHNAWSIYGLDKDGAVAEKPLAMLGRPQDWGDSKRWTYHRVKFEWHTAPDGKHYINNCHCWTDLKLESPAKYLELFAPLIVHILMPGEPAELCGRDFLEEEDFWSKRWGQQPPVYDRPGDDDWYDDEQEGEL